MKNTDQTNNLSHQDVSLLLPWYVNKTLDDDEKKCVDTHLKGCLLCRIELANQEKLSFSVAHADSLAPIAHSSFQQLQQIIHNSEQSTDHNPGVVNSFSGYKPARIKFNTLRNLFRQPASIALATLAIFSLILFAPDYFSVAKKYERNYRTLSSTVSFTAKDNEIRVVFAKPIDQQQIMRILRTINGRIITGPSLQGVYNIRIGKGDITKNDILKTISLLRRNDSVIFAEPAYSLLSKANPKAG